MSLTVNECPRFYKINPSQPSRDTTDRQKKKKSKAEGKSFNEDCVEYF